MTPEQFIQTWHKNTLNEEAGALGHFEDLCVGAYQHLRQTRKDQFEAWLTRMLRDESNAPNLVAALKAVLPPVTAR